eukprot:CAMPEP_0170915792 /NCGR_PEP_ID=MMETSP0735-20130129/6404_1 /TAXON_ID=186038 /ORGANISM="Fragilariopsis kerguelensis, Strain L26-C5" /LENGTH=709 /DNA_ID=CAMNT_0011313759 /DNA_START=138 /DNA_END=2267 /DNA_ORIENTATION=+
MASKDKDPILQSEIDSEKLLPKQPILIGGLSQVVEESQKVQTEDEQLQKQPALPTLQHQQHLLQQQQQQQLQVRQQQYLQLQLQQLSAAGGNFGTNPVLPGGEGGTNPHRLLQIQQQLQQQQQLLQQFAIGGDGFPPTVQQLQQLQFLHNQQQQLQPDQQQLLQQQRKRMQQQYQFDVQQQQRQQRLQQQQQQQSLPQHHQEDAHVVESVVEDSAVGEQASEEDFGQPLLLSAPESSLIEFLSSGPPQSVTPTPPPNGFDIEGIASLLNNRDKGQKYCIAIHFEEAIYLFHSVYMVDDEVFGCSARCDMLPSFLKFHVTELTYPAEGLVKFSEDEDTYNFRIPTITDLVQCGDEVSTLAEYPRLLQVPLPEAQKTPRPSAVILISGRFFAHLVTNVCDRSGEYGYFFQPVHALQYIQSVVQEEDDHYNPFIYFLVASHQNLNPSLTDLSCREVTATHYPKNRLVQDKFLSVKNLFTQFMESKQVRVETNEEETEQLRRHSNGGGGVGSKSSSVKFRSESLRKAQEVYPNHVNAHDYQSVEDALVNNDINYGHENSSFRNPVVESNGWSVPPTCSVERNQSQSNGWSVPSTGPVERNQSNRGWGDPPAVVRNNPHTIPSRLKPPPLSSIPSSSQQVPASRLRPPSKQHQPSPSWPRQPQQSQPSPSWSHHPAKPSLQQQPSQPASQHPSSLPWVQHQPSRSHQATTTSQL